MATLSDYAAFKPDTVAQLLATLVRAEGDANANDAVDALVTLANIEENAPTASGMQTVIEDAWRAGFLAALDTISDAVKQAADDAAFLAVIREREPDVYDMSARIHREIEGARDECTSGDDSGVMRDAWDYANGANVWADA